MTHVWPTSESFTAGAHVYGDFVSAYLKCAFWTSKNFAHPSSGTYTATQTAADMADLYSPTGAGQQRVATPLATCGAYLWRPLESSGNDVVSLGFTSKPLSGSGYSSTDRLLQMWVAARVTGSTYTSATHKHENVQDGYFFGFLNNASLFATWYLVRLNSGTATVLQSRAFTGDSKLGNEIDPTLVNELELDISASGSDVRLQCTLRKPDGAGGTTEISVFDYTDTSGSKITAAGRHGFAANGKLTVSGSPGGDCATTLTYFQIVNAGTLAVRDEWSRSYGKAGVETTDTIGTTTYRGWSMLCAWAGDFFTVAAYDKKLRRSQVSGLGSRVLFDPVAEVQGTGTGEGGFLSSLRRATDKRSQNRSAQIRFSSLKADGTSGATNPTPARMAGIFVRGSTTRTPSTTFVLSQGYLATLVYDDATSTCSCNLIRYYKGVAATIATKSSVSVSIDTDYTFRLDAYNLKDTTGNNVGAPILRVFLGGTQIVLVSVGASGVDVLASGTVRDLASNAQKEGPLEGLYCWIPNGDKTIFLDTWAEGSLTNSLETVQADYASIAVDDETDNDSGETWAIPYDWGYQEIHDDPSVVTPFESGHVQRNRLYSRKRRAWRVHCQASKSTEHDDLLDLWDTTKGCEMSFTFAAPDGSGNVTARIVGDSLATARRDVSAYGFGTVEIEEALS